MIYIKQLKKLRLEKLKKYESILRLDSYIDQCKALVDVYPDNYGTILESCYTLYTMDSTEIPPFKHLVDWISEQTPLLSGDAYGYSDRLYWIFNGLTDFPECANPNCHNKVGVGTHIKLHRGYPLYCCNRCAQLDEATLSKKRATCLLEYGDESYRNHGQMKRTNLERRGVECSFSCLDVQEKAIKTRDKHIAENPDYWKNRNEKTKNTKFKLYGDENYSNSEQARNTRNSRLEEDPHWYDESYAAGVKKRIETYGSNGHAEKALETREKHKKADPEFQSKINSKVKRSKLKTYGDENYTNVEAIKKTKLDKYGDENYNNHEQAEKTCLMTYGEEFPFSYGSDRFKQAMLDKYGVEHNSQVHEFRVKQQQRYTYNGINFASSPELALYIYAKDHNIEFEYQPDVDLWYEYDGKAHKYEPDFLIDGRLIEIKGDHFFNPDGTMRCPWDSSKDNLYEVKHQCMLKHNVVILRSADYRKYVDYVETKYGKGYLKGFKRQKKV